MVYRLISWLMACVLAVAGVAPDARAQSPRPQAGVALWATIPFIRGQDLCQYEDAYGRSRSALRAELTRDVQQLVMMGATAGEAAQAVGALDGLIDKTRRLATAGMGMDVLLEGSIKAQIDRIYGELQPRERALRFHNPATLMDILGDARDQRRQGSLTADQLRRIDGLMWGTYSYAPGCKGEVVVTLHVEFRDGTTISFGCAGRPDHVASQLAAQVFRHFQGTRTPATVTMDGRRLVILGAAPGQRQAHAPSLAMAVSACRALNGRLPSLAEYEQIGLLGEWNGGLNLAQDAWLLPDGKVYVPSMPRPSPVRAAADLIGEDLHFFCVR